MSSKVRMGIARHSGLLFILFLVVCNYKYGSQIIVQHYIANDVKWSHYLANDAMMMQSGVLTSQLMSQEGITSV